MESGLIQAQASVIREFANHPGMKLLCDKLQSKVKGKEHAWLNANAEEAEKIRQETRAYSVLMATLNEFLLKARADEASGSKSEQS